MTRLEKLALAAVAALTLTAPASLAQQASNSQSIDKDVQLFREDIRSQKKQLVAANMTLTDTEATKFWPVYDQYTAELVQINNKKYDIIKQYATNFDSLTDAQYEQMAKDWIQVDESVAQLRLKYIPIFRGVLSAKNTARFIQIDRRLLNMIDLQLASAIPLVQP